MASRKRRRGGVAGLEFALVAPVLVTLFLGTIDLSGALLTARRMSVAAGSVAEIATAGAAQTQGMNVLTDVQAWQATTAAFALFPQWTDQIAAGTFAITLSGVAFTATPAGCTQNCTYVAQVTWSVANELGAAQLRACGPLTSAPNADATSYTTLPAGNFLSIGNLGPTPLLVADIAFTFRPTFFGFLFGAIPMMQSAYISPRIGKAFIQLTSAGGVGVSQICPS
jgi:Flp pilus assembly protein TadG